MLEGGIRVPLAAQSPARLDGRSGYHGMVSSLDIVPTVAATTGFALPTDKDTTERHLCRIDWAQISPDRTFTGGHFDYGSTAHRGKHHLGVRNEIF